jgi:hypothetical protein
VLPEHRQPPQRAAFPRVKEALAVEEVVLVAHREQPIQRLHAVALAQLVDAHEEAREHRLERAAAQLARRAEGIDRLHDHVAAAPERAEEQAVREIVDARTASFDA